MGSRTVRHLAAAFVLIMALLLTACGDLVQGSGRVATESRQVSGVSSVVISGSGKLFITQGEQESLTITSDDNVLPYLTSDVSAGQLVLSTKPYSSFSRISELTYHLTVTDLRGIEIHGSADVDAQNIQADQLELTISGSGGCTISGSTDTLAVDVSGSGEFSGKDLASRVARVKTSGSGGALVQVSEELDAESSGSGSIRYVGSPQVTQRVSGSGTVAPLAGS